jgi:hypothetical protein
LRTSLLVESLRAHHFYASSTVYAVNSYLFLAGNLRKLEDFQFEVFTVSKAVCLSYQPSDLVVESLHLGRYPNQQRAQVRKPEKRQSGRGDPQSERVAAYRQGDQSGNHRLACQGGAKTRGADQLAAAV